MGNQTTVIIRNDALGDIRRNPEEFVKVLVDMIEHGKTGDFPCGSHAIPAQVIESHHADSTVIIAAGGSSARVLATLYNRWRWPIEREMRMEVAHAVMAKGANE